VTGWRKERFLERGRRDIVSTMLMLLIVADLCCGLGLAAQLGFGTFSGVFAAIQGVVHIPAAEPMPPLEESSPTPAESPTSSPAEATVPSAVPAGPAATATRTPSPPPTPGVTQYVVKPGDTLSGIAKEFGVTVEAIMEVNDLTNPNKIRVGQVLIIPKPLPKP
jgi:LysM repeat protein